jgi:Glutamate synthase domain 3
MQVNKNIIDATDMDFKTLNALVRNVDKDVTLNNVIGQRYIGAGEKGKKISINGVPGNALGFCLDSSTIEVFGNAQDAVGDTMNDGKIIIHGSVGDACGYAMRGGSIYIEKQAGYRLGIHMKAYKEKQPLIIIGEDCGSFLGEYLAGGTIIVLGLHTTGRAPVGFFCGTGMHGGKIILRTDHIPTGLPRQVICRDANEEDLEDIRYKIDEYCSIFSLNKDLITSHHFFILEPNSKNPYRQLYTNV